MIRVFFRGLVRGFTLARQGPDWTGASPLRRLWTAGRTALRLGVGNVRWRRALRRRRR